MIDEQQRNIISVARSVGSKQGLIDISLLPIYYNNVRSVTNKHNICTKIELSIYLILILTETWLSKRESSSVYFPNGFKVHRYDRIVLNSLRRYGGIAVLVHKDLRHRRVELNEFEKCKFVAVEITLNPVPLVIYAVYMREFELEIALKHVNNIKELSKRFHKHRIMVIGDFNMYSVRWLADESGTHFIPTNAVAGMESFLHEMQDLSFFQLSDVANKFNNVLDLVFVNETGDMELMIDKSKIIGTVQQDVSHVPYEISFEYCKKRTSMNIVEKEILCYKAANYERVCDQLSKIDLVKEIDDRDVDSAFDYFYSIMNDVVSNNVPRKTIVINANRPVWWTKKLQSLKNRRDKLFKRDRNGDEYKEVLQKFDELSSKLFDQYIDDVQDKIKINPAEFWRFAKLDNKSASYPGEMHFKGIIGRTTEEIVELFADFFEQNYVADQQQWSFEKLTSYRRIRKRSPLQAKTLRWQFIH